MAKVAAPSNTNRYSSVANQTAGSQQRPQAQVYLNVGLTSVTPEGETRFDSPFGGVPVDNVDIPKWALRDPKYKNFVKLFHALQAAGEKLAPGEARMLNLEVELRRRAEDVEDTSDVSDDFIESLFI